MKKETTIFVLKLVVAVATAILGVLGASSLVSCDVHKYIESKGKAVIVTVDTTIVNHDGSITFKSK